MPDEGFIDNVIARSLHSKRRSNPLNSTFLTGLLRQANALLAMTKLVT
ncbi:MAG: hypothetical protein LBK53_03825 [Heliobacteriaceae bacterium]|nr:hypothetical protein [Heliobacteriaceae bacterium]